MQQQQQQQETFGQSGQGSGDAQNSTGSDIQNETENAEEQLRKLKAEIAERERQMKQLEANAGGGDEKSTKRNGEVGSAGGPTPQKRTKVNEAA